MMETPIDKDHIDWVIPKPSLNDLSSSSSDIDNDIDLMLNHLQPYFPPSLLQNNFSLHQIKSTLAADKVSDPSQRVRAAIRSCLKDETNQLEFVRLYQNSISSRFNEFFAKFYHSIPTTQLTFLDYFHIIKIITTYYNSSLVHLNLSPLARNLCTRNINSLFYNNLVIRQNPKNAQQSQHQQETHFLRSLQEFLDVFVFKNTLANPFSDNSVNLIDIFNTLISINLNKDINQLLIQLSIQKIKLFIVASCSGIWDKPLLETITDFIQNEIYPNFSIIASYSADINLTNSVNNVYLYDLIKLAQLELVSLRIKEIYSIILYYPNSTDCLYELYHCLSTKFNHHHYNQTLDESHHSTNMINNITNLSNFSYLANYSLKSQAYQRAKLVDTFVDLCHKNLLHSGANTVDVITTYTKTIKSFLIIDPKGVLLDKVVRPIRRYLKTREDIIIKIVHGLLDDDESTNELIELAKELRRAKVKISKKSNVVEDTLDMNWVPDPIDALPDFKKGKVSDIIESLISIFDSNEIFINEFTRLFGQRLVNLHNYNVTDIEDRLNLLKLRFGKNEFTTLDIMIKDIKESKTLNQKMMDKSGVSEADFHTSILSHLFWPTVLENLSDNDNFSLPPEIDLKFKAYNSIYSAYMKGRSLKFLPSLGSVKLELSFNNKIAQNFEVTPDKAAIISLFDDNSNELSVDFIAKHLKMSPYMVSKGLSFWVREGVLLDLTKTLFIVNEDDSEDDPLNSASIPSAATVTNSGSDKSINPKFKELEVLWPYLKSMLENISYLKFERVKTLLKLTVPKDKFDFGSIDDSKLEDYLDWLVDEGKLEITQQSYKLKA